MKQDDKIKVVEFLRGEDFKAAHSEYRSSTTNLNSPSQLSRKQLGAFILIRLKMSLDLTIGNIETAMSEVLRILFKRNTEKRKLAVQLPPGHLLILFADFFFSRRKNERLFLPLISDMREEYYQASAENRLWKARWVQIRGAWSFFAVIGADRAYSMVLLFVKAWKGVS